MLELLSLLVIVSPLGLFIHEFGHVVFGLWFGADRSTLVTGSGRMILSKTFGKLTLQLNLLFFIGGYSFNEKQVAFNPWQQAGISLGGPLLNIIFAAGLFISDLIQYGQIIQLLFWFNLYLALVNMIPFRIKERESDGFRFLKGLKQLAG
ncbi:site-2 protease family protein [Halobacillus hunanensis]|uniref:site-2 protease family protein n=1 Tax=Halobacillus hunanensis TaxID=578214 RepID=UPI0009A58292|nr:site-2 protease family protein [Halobacillus hunanensis]